MWKIPTDTSEAIITAQKHVAAQSHVRGNDGAAALRLPETALLFYINRGDEYMLSHYETQLLTDKFPRFLRACPVYQVKTHNRLCFLDGGRGAPHAVDTLETLAALGVKNVVTVGMFGAYADDIQFGDLLIPGRAFVEEGTSLHYYESIEYACPDADLHARALRAIGGKDLPLVSTDAVYRQTFMKEALWRQKGAVGVDMETSALFSVGKCLGVKVVSILAASDKHPMHPGDAPWHWKMTPEMRASLFEKCASFALSL